MTNDQETILLLSQIADSMESIDTRLAKVYPHPHEIEAEASHAIDEFVELWSRASFPFDASSQE